MSFILPKRTKLQVPTILDIPYEVLIGIFQYLEEPFITQLGIVCKLFNRVSNDPNLYSYIIQRNGITNYKKRLFSESKINKIVYSVQKTRKRLEKAKDENLQSTYFYNSLNRMIDAALSFNANGFFIQIAPNKFLSKPYTRPFGWNTRFTELSLLKLQSFDMICNHNSNELKSMTKKVVVDIKKIYEEFSQIKLYEFAEEYYTKHFKNIGYNVYLSTQNSNLENKFSFCLYFGSKFHSEAEFQDFCKNKIELVN